MSDSDKSKTIEFIGIYYANSMIPQGELELEKIVKTKIIVILFIFYLSYFSYY